MTYFISLNIIFVYVIYSEKNYIKQTLRKGKMSTQTYQISDLIFKRLFSNNLHNRNWYSAGWSFEMKRKIRRLSFFHTFLNNKIYTRITRRGEWCEFDPFSFARSNFSKSTHEKCMENCWWNYYETAKVTLVLKIHSRGDWKGTRG